MIVALVGEDAFSKELEIEKFLQETLGEKKEDPLAKKIIYATDTTIHSLSDTVIEACDTTSLFAEEQAVVIRRAEALKASDAKALAAWILTKPSCALLFDFNKLLLTSALAKAIKSCGSIQKFDSPKPWEMEKWIINLCQTKFGRKIEPGASRYLADALGTDTANIASELEKVLQHSPDLKIFPESLVREIIVPQREMLAWEIRESFGNRDAKAYLRKLHELMLLPKIDGVQIVAALFDYAVQLLHTISMLEQGKSPEEIAQTLGINSFIFCKKMNEPAKAKKWGKPLLCRVIRRLAELDAEFKNGSCPTKVSRELALAILVIPPK